MPDFAEFRPWMLLGGVFGAALVSVQDYFGRQTVILCSSILAAIFQFVLITLLNFKAVCACRFCSAAGCS